MFRPIHSHSLLSSSATLLSHLLPLLLLSIRAPTNSASPPIAAANAGLHGLATAAPRLNPRLAAAGNRVEKLTMGSGSLLLSLLLVLVVVNVGVAVNQDGLSLLDARRALAAPDGALADWNARDATPCSWTGVSCDAGVGGGAVTGSPSRASTSPGRSRRRCAASRASRAST